MVEDTQCGSGTIRFDGRRPQPGPQTSALLEPHDEPDSAPTTPSIDSDTASLLKPAFSATTPYQPLTSSSEATLNHLRPIGGRLARFRGLGLWILFSTIPSQLGRAASMLLGGGLLATVTCTYLFHVAAAPLQMAWTHIVISRPTGLWFWQRIQWRQTPAILLPTAIWAVTPVIVRVFEDFLHTKYLAWTSRRPESHEEYMDILHDKVTGFVLLSIFWFFVLPLIYVPGNIILVRCQAALLSDQEFPIIRLDRSFGGLTTNGKLSVMDAWRSFQWEGRQRVAKMYVRAVVRLALLWSLLVTALWVAFYVGARHVESQQVEAARPEHSIEGFGLFDTDD